jgi:hypothetical protein
MAAPPFKADQQKLSKNTFFDAFLENFVRKNQKIS